MGSDKALVELGGQPLVELAVGILKDSGLPVHIAGSREDARTRLECWAPVVRDEGEGLGPLAGVCAGLRSTRAAYTVFLAVDVPFMPSSLIIYLLWHARVTKVPVTVASVNGFSQTFPAVIAREILPALDKRLRGGDLGCLAAFQAASVESGAQVAVIPVERLVQSGQVAHPEALPAARWFVNLNTAEELCHAMSLRSRRVS